VGGIEITLPVSPGVDGGGVGPFAADPAVALRSIWAVLIGFMIVLMCQIGFLAHQVAFLTERFDSAAVGATAIGTAAIGSAVARLVVGSFADNVDKRILSVVLVLGQAATVLGLVVTDNLAANYTLVLVFGFTMGNIFMMQSLLVAEIFGIRSFGSIFGISSAASQVAGGVGPVLVGTLEYWTGSYSVPSSSPRC
jgi:MFS family permease